ncbi:MAG: hypothetical protein IPP34_15685 [Bacteroidetes bacterium]|nr:hypothetical protein [Bacteroidota bacterium]
MKTTMKFILLAAILIGVKYDSNAQWSISGNAGTTSTNFLGTTDAQPIRFKTQNSQHMVIDAIGRIGIGVTNPAYKLDIANASIVRTLNLNNTTSTTSTSYGGYSTSNNAGTGDAVGFLGFGKGTGGVNYGLYGTASDGTTNYGVYGKITTSTTTPVGIGTYGFSTGAGTTNYGMLANAGGAATTNYGIYATATGGTTNWAGYFVQNTYIGGSMGIGSSVLTDTKFAVQQTGTTTATGRFSNTSKGPNISWIHFGTTGDWYIRSASNTGKVIMQDQNSSATVCIGGTTAATGYKLSVKGKIICEELKVLLSATWPDYVFGKNYNLMPLSDLENFIEEENHLPGIPSAKEMEADGGIALGEMQTILVKKIEEANLYILQLNKRIEELESKLK